MNSFKQKGGVMSRENTPERLADRVRQAVHNEEQILARRDREAAGCREWADRHSRHAGLPIRRDDGPIRDRTVSESPLY